MLHGAFALLERSLRVDARAWTVHLTRLGLVGAIYFSLCYALFTSFMFGAPGLHFFQGISYLDAAFMTLLGLGYFTTSITEEKEEDTLGLMLMAGISPLGILVGKSGGRLWQSVLLVGVQFPFILLAVTMGGVMASQVWSVTIALVAYMVLLAGFGLLCSTLAPRSQVAMSWMVVGLAIYFLVPSLADEWFTEHMKWLANQTGLRAAPGTGWKLLGVIGEVCVFNELGKILETGFNKSVWSLQVISNGLGGIVCAGLSWAFFGVATRSTSSEANTRGLVSRNRKLSPFFTGRIWNNAFAWKDFHFVAGGTGMILVRMAYFTSLGLFAMAIETDYNNNSGWFWFIGFVMWFSVAVDAARVLSRSMHDEVRGQTLGPLMMLPRSSIGIVYAKFGGAMLGWLPGPIICLIVTFVSPSMRKCFGEMIEPRTHGAILLFVVLLFALIPHFAALLSLYVRWGSVALAIGLAIGAFFMAQIGSEILASIFPSMGGADNINLFCFSFGLFCVCVGCHMGVLLRVQALGAK